MKTTAENLTILEDGENPQIDLKQQNQTIPRVPQWSDTFSYIANPDQFCRRNLQEYGPIFKTSVFGGTTIFVGAADAVQMIFNGDNQYTEIGLPPTTMEMFGEYSLFQRPDLHRQRKSGLQPAFTGQMLAGYIPRIQQIIQSHFQTWSTQTPINLVPSVEKISFDILVELLLGINLENDKAALAGLPITSKQELKQIYKTFFNGFYGLVKWDSPLTTFGRGLKARKCLIEFMQAVIKRYRQENTNINPTDNFLAMMLVNQENEPEGIFCDRLIENQCLLQLWASHYEIMGLLASWVYQVGHYPDIIDKLRSEKNTLLPNSNLPITTTQIKEIVKEMVFLDATIKETLRIFPPSSTANRRLTKSIIFNGIQYQKGWTFIVEPRIAHFLSENFTNPDQFTPERFLPPQQEGKMYEYIPFGGGVHACLGAQLAMTITKIFAVNFLDSFNWQLIGEAEFIQFPLRKIKDNYQITLTKFIRD